MFCQNSQLTIHGKYSHIFSGDNNLTGDVSFLCDLDVFRYDDGEFNPACTFNQRDIMATVYLALNKYYFSIDPECEWPGASCNSNGAVVGISLGK